CGRRAGSGKRTGQSRDGRGLKGRNPPDSAAAAPRLSDARSRASVDAGSGRRAWNFRGGSKKPASARSRGAAKPATQALRARWGGNPVRVTALGQGSDAPDLLGVLANGAVAREFPRTCDIQHRFAAPLVTIRILTQYLLLRTRVRAEVRQMEVLLAVIQQLLRHGTEQPRFIFREPVA